MRCGISSPKVISWEPTAVEKEGSERGREWGRRIGIQNPPGSTRQSVRRTHSRLPTSLLKTAMPHHRMADDDYGNDGDGDGFSEFKQGRRGTREGGARGSQTTDETAGMSIFPSSKASERARGSMRRADGPGYGERGGSAIIVRGTRRSGD